MALSEEDRTVLARRRSKNVAVALVLVGLVVLFYLLTIVKITANIS